jgi:hypothetical protein
MGVAKENVCVQVNTLIVQDDVRDVLAITWGENRSTLGVRLIQP